MSAVALVSPSFVLVVVGIAVLIAIPGALIMRSRLRSPMLARESRRRVESLVTEIVPEEHPEADDEAAAGPVHRIDSPPPDPDPGLRRSPDPS